MPSAIHIGSYTYIENADIISSILMAMHEVLAQRLIRTTITRTKVFVDYVGYSLTVTVARSTAHTGILT